MLHRCPAFAGMTNLRYLIARLIVPIHKSKISGWSYWLLAVSN